MTIFKTEKWDGFGRQNYYWHEYRLEENQVVKYKCHKFKLLENGKEDWCIEEQREESWLFNDPDLPEFLKEYL